MKQVLARASEARSGDEQAGVAASSMRERAAAKLVLAELTLRSLREAPSVAYEDDEVTRVIEDSFDDHVFSRIANWSLGELRNWILDDATDPEDIAHVGRELPPEAVAGLASLMSNLDLVLAARKLRVVVRCNATMGLPGRISSRLQPNHPTDEVAGILAAVRDGLSYGNGDAVIGVNPATESVDNVVEILAAVKGLMRRYQVPTQNCVLAHVALQMKALERGAPLDLMFQSIAGSEGANRNFGVTIALLDEALDMATSSRYGQGPERHVLRDRAGHSAVSQRPLRHRSAHDGGAYLRVGASI